MAYTSAQLIAAYTAANNGVEPDGATAALLSAFATQTQTGQMSDAAALSYVINSAEDDVQVAVQAYQFFTGAIPSAGGLDYLTNSDDNTNDLNDAYYAQFNLENRYINFAANLGLNGEGSTGFADAYGDLTFASFVDVIYETIIGSSYATAAGINVAAAKADIAGRYNNFVQLATERGMITSASTPEQIDLAVKASVVGYLMAEGVKADVGIYAAGANNFVNALVDGDAQYGADLLETYSVLGGGTGSPVSEGPASGGGQTINLTINQDTVAGTSGNDVFVAGVALNGAGNPVDTLQNFDVLNGGTGADTLQATINGGAAVTPSLTSVENVVARFTAGGGSLSLASATGVESVVVENSSAAGTVTSVGAAALGVRNQNQNASFDGITATTLNLAVDTAGTAAAPVVIDLATATASKATAASLTVNNASIEINSTQADALATATIAATGANAIKFTDSADDLTSVTISGAGSVNLSAVDLVKVATLTAGDGGVTFKNGDSTAATFTATTGGGKDSLTVDGANVKSISTGAGADTVTTATAALVSTATVDLGAGDDSLVLHAAPAAGATLSGGDGVDTFGVATAGYTTVSGYGAADLAKITGFEVLSITDVLADGTAIDVSKISGITSFQTVGVTATKAATVSNVGNGGSVIFKGDLATNSGALTVALKDATGASDSLNVTVNTKITQNNDGAVDTTAATVTLTAAGVETLNVVSTGNLSAAPATGAKIDVAKNTLALTDDALTTLNVTGNQAFVFTSGAGMTKLATVDASGLTAGGATINLTAATSATTVTGSANADVLTGGTKADVISGGAGADVIQGREGADQLTGGAGNDVFVYANTAHSTLANLDVIGDFSANTFGNGALGAAGTGAGAAASRTGDVIQIDVTTILGGGAAAALADGVVVSVQSNAADAQTFLQNLGVDATAAVDNAVGAALDSSTGRLYLDIDSNGTVDSVIQLTGVTSLTAAAFELV